MVRQKPAHRSCERVDDVEIEADILSTGSSYSDSQRTSVSCMSTSSQLPTKLQLGAKTSLMLPSRTRLSRSDPRE